MARKTKHLSDEDRSRIVLHSESGMNKSEIARMMKITRVTVINTLRKHAETKSVKNRKGQGRKILSNERDNITLLRQSRNVRRRSSQELAKLWKDSSNVNATPVQSDDAC